MKCPTYVCACLVSYTCGPHCTSVCTHSMHAHSALAEQAVSVCVAVTYVVHSATVVD